MKLIDISSNDLRQYYNDSVVRLHLTNGGVVTGYVVAVDGDSFYMCTKGTNAGPYDTEVHRSKVRDITLPALGYFVWHDVVMYAARVPLRFVGKGLSGRNVQVAVARGWELLAPRKRTPCNAVQASLSCAKRAFPIEGKTYRILSEDVLEVISPNGRVFKYVKEIHVPTERSAAPRTARQSRRVHKAGNNF